jgi:hypothetical protein
MDPATRSVPTPGLDPIACRLPLIAQSDTPFVESRRATRRLPLRRVPAGGRLGCLRLTRRLRDVRQVHETTGVGDGLPERRGGQLPAFKIHQGLEELRRREDGLSDALRDADDVAGDRSSALVRRLLAIHVRDQEAAAIEVLIGTGSGDPVLCLPDVAALDFPRKTLDLKHVQVVVGVDDATVLDTLSDRHADLAAEERERLAHERLERVVSFIEEALEPSRVRFALLELGQAFSCVCNRVPKCGELAEYWGVRRQHVAAGP